MAIKFVVALYLVFTLFMAHTNSTSARELVESDCLNARGEINSTCSDEIAIFLNDFGTSKYVQLDRESHCCQLIKFISHQCSPALLTSLGYTTNECDILRGYCEMYSGPPLVPAPSPKALNSEAGGSVLE